MSAHSSIFASISVVALLLSFAALGILFVFPGPQGPPGPAGTVPSGLNETLSSLNRSVSSLENQLVSLRAESSTAANLTPSNSLTLVEIMEAEWNASIAQPKFFVLGTHGLESSTNITLPVNTTVQLTIISYDTPTPNSTTQEGSVKGTIGNSIYVINGTLATGMSNESTAQMVDWGENVSSVPTTSIAHTFTILQLGINIPVVAGSVVIAYVHFDKAGTYAWICLTPCGFGENGMSGAMGSQGWMMGNLIVE